MPALATSHIDVCTTRLPAISGQKRAAIGQEKWPQAVTGFNFMLKNGKFEGISTWKKILCMFHIPSRKWDWYPVEIWSWNLNADTNSNIKDQSKGIHNGRLQSKMKKGNSNYNICEQSKGETYVNSINKKMVLSEGQSL